MLIRRVCRRMHASQRVFCSFLFLLVKCLCDGIHIPHCSHSSTSISILTAGLSAEEKRERKK